MRRALAAVLLALAGCGPEPAVPHSGFTVGLFTSLPLLWREHGDIRGQLNDPAPAHWSLRVLARHGRVVPLDSLAGAKGLALPRDAVLLLAQPRPFTPQENVALDDWVRAGGRVLLFADPMLTSGSAYPLGDPRRPQDIAMLSPILRHWGLELVFDPQQPAGPREVKLFGLMVPIDLAGRFRASADAKCATSGDGLGVDCTIGKGRVLALADAAVFDGEDAGRAAVLNGLLDRLQR